MKLFEGLFNRGKQTLPVPSLSDQIALAEAERNKLAAEMGALEEAFLAGEMDSAHCSSRRHILEDQIHLMDTVIGKLQDELAERDRLARETADSECRAATLTKQRGLARQYVACVSESDELAAAYVAKLAQIHSIGVELSRTGVHDHSKVLRPASIAYALRWAGLNAYTGLAESTSNHTARPLVEIAMGRLGTLINSDDSRVQATFVAQ